MFGMVIFPDFSLTLPTSSIFGDLNPDEITVFNSSIIKIKGSDNFLVASRGWYGNVRSWDGINFIILTIMNKNMKKIKQNILDVDKNILNENIIKRRLLKFKEFNKDKFVRHRKSNHISKEIGSTVPNEIEPKMLRRSDYNLLRKLIPDVAFIEFHE